MYQYKLTCLERTHIDSRREWVTHNFETQRDTCDTLMTHKTYIVYKSYINMTRVEHLLSVVMPQLTELGCLKKEPKCMKT
jgi:hypothetical protein